MPNHDDRPQAEILRLKKQLEITQKQLFELENGRLVQVYKHFRQSLVNPWWGFKNIHRLPSKFSKTAFPELIDSPTSYRPALMGEEEGSFMPYPNLKVVTLGEVPDLSIYCHPLTTNGTEWRYLYQNGLVDALLIGELSPQDKAATEKTIKMFEDANIPVFQLERLKNAPVVDLGAFNPMGLSGKQFTRPVGAYTKGKKLSKLELYKYSAVIIRPADFDDESAHTQAVLESLSCGIPVVTSKTGLLGKWLPSSFYFCQTKAQERQLLNKVKADVFSWQRYSIPYRRHIHLSYSPRRLADELAKRLEFKVQPFEPIITMIVSTNRPERLANALASVKNQTYPRKELILILHGDGFKADEVKKMTTGLDFPVKLLEQAASTQFGDNLNLAVDMAKGEYITKMDDDDYYGPNHLEDLLAAYQFSRATVVGKRTNLTYLEARDTVVTFSGGKEETFVWHLPGATIFTRTEIMRHFRFGKIKKHIDSEMFRRLEARGGTFYSTHCFNFIRVRHGQKHTYAVADEDYIVHSSTKPVAGLKKQDYYG